MWFFLWCGWRCRINCHSSANISNVSFVTFILWIATYLFSSLIAFLISSITAAAFSVPLVGVDVIGLTMAKRSMPRPRYSGYSSRSPESPPYADIVFWSMQLMIGFLQAVIAIVTSFFSCRVVCSRDKPATGAAVVFNPGTTHPGGEFTTIPLSEVLTRATTSSSDDKKGEL